MSDNMNAIISAEDFEYRFEDGVLEEELEYPPARRHDAHGGSLRQGCHTVVLTLEQALADALVVKRHKYLADSHFKQGNADFSSTN